MAKPLKYQNIVVSGRSGSDGCDTYDHRHVWRRRLWMVEEGKIIKEVKPHLADMTPTPLYLRG